MVILTAAAFQRASKRRPRQPADIFQEVAIKAPLQFRALVVLAELILRTLGESQQSA